jgi:hypothetical protein
VAWSCEHCNETSGSITGGNSWLAAWLLASQDGLCSMELLFLQNRNERLGFHEILSYSWQLSPLITLSFLSSVVRTVV